MHRTARASRYDARLCYRGGIDASKGVTMGVQRRNTRQRALVLDAVRAHDDHPTADDIYLDVRQQDEKISRGTVYRNLNLLEEAGIISSVKTPGGNRFDWRSDGHAHILCRKCGRVQDVPLAYDLGLDEACGAQTGFAGIDHSTLFTGICPDCLGDSPVTDAAL